MDLDAAQKLAYQLMDDHLLGWESLAWSFKFDTAKRRNGSCHYGKRTITLSRYFVELNDEVEVRLTILHEIAHALTPGHHHDAVWKAKCAELGGVPVTCFDSASSTRNVVKVEGKWRAVCPNCKSVFHRHRKVREGVRWCKACGRALGILTFRLNEGE